ncbi:MAG: hypothetical protein J6328_02955 [Bacilli bacterium]|nr:hypothetical protein [Bacilli bacterium]
MEFIPYLFLAAIIGGFIAVIIYWVRLKRRGGKILEDGCQISGKALVKLYHLQKEREQREKAGR